MNGRKTDDSRSLIAVVEDDHLVAGTMLQALGDFGFRTEWCRTAGDLNRLMKTRPPDLCIIDLGLPDADGLDLVRHLQEAGNFAILVVTGRSLLTDRVLGLEMGADDYMAKPFEPRELIARVRSILRRYGKSTIGGGACKRVAAFGNWCFEPATLTIENSDGSREELSAAEGRLLTYLLENPHRILTREQIAGSRDISAFDRSIDVRISRLRKRLLDDPSQPSIIKTVYGAGYLFAIDVRWKET